MARKKKSAPRDAGIDAIALLENDHENVRKLLSELEETTWRAVRRREALTTEIAQEVRIHARIEEEIFYPAFRGAAETKEDERLFLEAAEEHGLVDLMLAALEETDPASELFDARAKVLKHLIEHHAEEEETHLFPRVRELMTEEALVDLGLELQERKLVLMEDVQEAEEAAIEIERAPTRPARSRDGTSAQPVLARLRERASQALRSKSDSALLERRSARKR